MQYTQPVAGGERRLLLHAGGDATTALDDMAEHLGASTEAVFLPYAHHDLDRHTALAQARRFDAINVRLTGLHRFPDPVGAIQGADAIVVGGGNSFRLVDSLHRLDLIEPVRRAVSEGVPYVGSSAGANMACPTIRTTNDMPIVQPSSLAAFGLVSFQINPHYLDPPAPELRIGETRDERLAQFLEENDVPVVGLREGSWILVNGDHAVLRGSAGAMLFQRGDAPFALLPGVDLSWLLRTEPKYDQPI